MVSRNYVFTINNPEGLLNPDEFENLRYMIYSEENAGTNHFQGYFELLKPQRISWIKNHWAGFEGAHLEPRRGTQAQAIAYCSKEDETHMAGPYTFGEPGAQGRRQDLITVQNAIKDGHSRKRVAEDHFPVWVQFHKAFDIYRDLTAAPKAPKYAPTQFTQPLEQAVFQKAHLFCGPTNIGKTGYALAHFKNPLYVDHIDRLKQLTEEHDGIVFDDMDFRHWPAASVIHLLDYDQEHQIHNRYTNAVIPKGMPRIFTFNFHTPLEGMDGEKSEYLYSHKEAIRRRYISIEFSSDLRKSST